jgi:hypothetical protein
MPLYNPTTINGHLLAATDNVYDIGALGATRPRSIYVGTNITAGGDLAVTGQAAIGSLECGGAALVGSLTSEGATNLQGSVTVAAHVNLAQIADTGAPASNTINIFAMDNGGSSTLALRCEQAVATETVTSDRTLTVLINNVAYKLCLKV